MYIDSSTAYLYWYRYCYTYSLYLLLSALLFVLYTYNDRWDGLSRYSIYTVYMQACRQDARFPLRDANARCVPSEFPLLLVRALMCILYEYLETYVHNCRGTHVAVHLFFLKKRFRVSKMACAVFLSFVTSACTYFSVLYFELTSPKQYPPPPAPSPPLPPLPPLPQPSPFFPFPPHTPNFPDHGYSFSPNPP